jgi:hypothetical protein
MIERITYAWYVMNYLWAYRNPQHKGKIPPTYKAWIGNQEESK